MISLRTALIFALAPLVSFSATLISHTREVSASAQIYPDPEVREEDSTLLDGYALLGASVNLVSPVGAQSRLESVISPDRFWVPNFFTGASATAELPSFSSALLLFEVDFEVAETETWFLDVSLFNGFLGDSGSGATLGLANRAIPGLPGVVFRYNAFTDDPIFDSKKLLLAPGSYRLQLVADAGSFGGGGAGSSGSFSLTQQPIPEPSTYLGVSAVLAGLLLCRLKPTKVETTKRRASESRGSHLQVVENSSTRK